MSTQEFIALNRLRGLTQRQCRLLDLEAIYRGTNYEGLPPWSQVFTDDDRGTRMLCGHEKKPYLLAGIIEEKVNIIVAKLVGEGRFPTITLEPAGAEPSRSDKTQTPGSKLVKRLEDEGRLKKKARKLATDIIVKGSGGLGFSIIEGGRIELLRFAPEWSEPILVCKAGRPRAAALAAEMDEYIAQGWPIRLDAPRSEDEHLWTPEGAASDDVCWFRYEYVYHEEAAIQDGGRADEVWRLRTDYTPWQVIDYEPMRVPNAASAAPGWQVRKVTDHDYGIVPVAWGRSIDAEDGEVDGPSLVTEALRSIAEAADRMLTRKDESVGVVANPKAYTIDLDDAVADFNAQADKPAGWRASSKEVLSFTTRSGKQGQIDLLEPTGKGAEVAKAHLDDLDARATRVSGVMSHDPQQAANVQSGVALERQTEPTVAVVNAYRVALGEALTLLTRKLAQATGLGELVADAQWPDVVGKTSADRQAEGEALSKVTGGATLISQETAVKLAAAIWGVEDPEEEVRRVTADAEQAMQAARDALAQRPAPVVPDQQPPPLPGA